MSWAKLKQRRNTLKPMTGAQRQAKHKSSGKLDRLADIAVLDFETDPFDAGEQTRVRPFLAVIHSRQFDDIVIWKENFDDFIDAVLSAIESLPRAFTIYAHNGGKFDFMFFVHKLRGEVMFKGRGIMLARIGNHELRDSFHIIPEKLKGYKKDDFDYELLRAAKRDKNKQAIITYCLNDCVYLLDIVLAFVNRFGRKLSIGQAAQENVKKTGHVVQKLSENFDAYLRNFYFGGRVECLGGIGVFESTPDKQYKLYDVNSMYPAAMAQMTHPIGGQSDYIVRKGQPNKDTAFVELECSNYGALVARMPDGSTSATLETAKFFTTIHEYKAAIDLGLIENVTILNCVDCAKFTDFSSFVLPLYAERQVLKENGKRLKEAGLEDTPEYLDNKKSDMFMKFLLNNAYGKYAQNPRRFKEAYITDIGQRPETELAGFTCCSLKQEFVNGEAKCSQCQEVQPAYGPFPKIENRELGYAIWERPTRRLSFNNVGTAASITGAARSILMRAIACADNPIYCDTDSLICIHLRDHEIHPTKLGAWDIEDHFARVLIAGKKQYACDKGDHLPDAKRYKYAMKGSEGMDWADFQAMLDGKIVEKTARGPTMTRAGKYFYMVRNIRATGPLKGNTRLLEKRTLSHG